ncbi:MAG TPA: galactose oxidase early set domain-containing protein [Planctomycetota bacterium]|nr:galactose oxidase early set domain-containing protein [Planctomycetota bacterium]
MLGGIEQAVFNPPSGLVGNGVFLASDRSYLTHEAFNVDSNTGPTWASVTIDKDTRPGGVLPTVSGTPVQVPGLFLGTTTPTMPNFPFGYSLFYYGRAHYLSNAVFGGGPAHVNGVSWIGGMPVGSVWIDHPVDANLWPTPQPLLTTVTDIIDEPTAVLLPASLNGGGSDRIALFGGQLGLNSTTPPSPITNLVHLLDAKLLSPTWSTTAMPPMNHERKFANSVLLPDSSVLIVGGGINGATGGKGGEVFVPEVFRGTTWQDGPPETSPRTYHSTSLLLPSGRVVSMGGDTRRWDMQIYQPHYWQAGTTRPVVASAPSALTYGSDFVVTYTLAPGRTLAKASLTTPGSVTHSHDPNQRLVELAITGSNSTSATLSAPADPTKAPYGHYMLWLVDSAGEVSAAVWTRL